MTNQVVFHVDQVERWSTLVGNLKNLISDIPTATIVVVINGPAIELYLDPAVQKLIKSLPQVQFEACRHAMASHKIEPAQLISAIKVVPGGVSELMLRQQAGFAYIKP